MCWDALLTSTSHQDSHQGRPHVRLWSTPAEVYSTGQVDPQESFLHINVLKLQVVYNACHHFLPEVKGHSMRIITQQGNVVERQLPMRSKIFFKIEKGLKELQ